MSLVPPLSIPDSRSATAAVGQLALLRQLWPLLVAAFICSLPFPAIAIFTAPVASDLGTTAALVGGLRGLGGVAALAVGFLLAPLIDRIPRTYTVSGGIALVALADALLLGRHVALLAGFYVVLGATTAVLLPAIQAACADRFRGPASGQAVSLVNSLQALSGVLAGPLLAVPAAVTGWQGAFGLSALLTLVTAVLVAPVLGRGAPQGVERAGYLEAFGLVGRAPGALGLLITSTLRSCLFFGWITYLAAFYAERFAASTGLTALIWSLGAGSFLVANLITGRLVNAASGDDDRGWQAPLTLLKASLPAHVALAPLAYLAPTMPLSLVAMAVFCGVAGVTLAALISLLIRRYPTLRGAVMGLNMAGQNFGSIVGASVAGLGLGLGSYEGLAATLVVMALATFASLIVALRSLRGAPAA